MDEAWHTGRGPSATPGTPISYNFVGGTEFLEVDVSGIGIVFSTSSPLTGTFTTFDVLTPAVADLQWVI